MAAISSPGSDASRLRRAGDDAGRESGRAPRLYQRAFEILARQIEDGALSAGAPLHESRIAARLGVSRAPARRALAELERKGLVAKAAGRGYTVRGDARREPQSPSLAAAEAMPRLVSASTWQPIYREVEREIAARIPFASWRIVENDLARHHGVSRTVAREVLARLQQRGVVRQDERSRWYAPALTPDHVGELYELRWLLEPVALVKAAPNLPSGFLAGMRARLEAAIAHASEIEGPTLDRLEEEMHIALLGHCGNRMLIEAIALPQALLIAHRFLYRWTARLFETEPFLPEHLVVVERLERGKVAEAAKALERHLRISRERAITRIAAIARRFDPEDLPYLERRSPG
jgi:DNA-binding GntR family transcriptional regulator